MLRFFFKSSNLCSASRRSLDRRGRAQRWMWAPHWEPLSSPVQKVLLAELQDLHVPHVLEKDVSFGDHFLQFLKAFPQCQVVLQPTLLDLININHTEVISLVTRWVVGVRACTHTHPQPSNTHTDTDPQRRTFWVSISWRMVPISLLIFSLCISASCSWLSVPWSSNCLFCKDQKVKKFLKQPKRNETTANTHLFVFLSALFDIFADFSFQGREDLCSLLYGVNLTKNTKNHDNTFWKTSPNLQAQTGITERLKHFDLRISISHLLLPLFLPLPLTI